MQTQLEVVQIVPKPARPHAERRNKRPELAEFVAGSGLSVGGKVSGIGNNSIFDGRIDSILRNRKFVLMNNKMERCGLYFSGCEAVAV